MEDEIFDISDYFTKKNEEEGVWDEIRIDGKGIGWEFKIYGASSDEAVIASEQYEKDIEAASTEGDPVKRNQLETEAVIKRLVAVIIDIRRKDGKPFLIQGKPFQNTKENIRFILEQSRVIRKGLLSSLAGNTTFMTKKG